MGHRLIELNETDGKEYRVIALPFSPYNPPPCGKSLQLQPVACGALLRHAIFNIPPHIIPIQFPYRTLIVNIVGSFVIGFHGFWSIMVLCRRR